MTLATKNTIFNNTVHCIVIFITIIRIPEVNRVQRVHLQLTLTNIGDKDPEPGVKQ